MTTPKPPERQCGDCTECCKGYVWGEAHGKKFYAGRPCFYKGEKGCTIYENRPHDPCVTFRCGWLDAPDKFPEWLKPSISKLLAVKQRTKNGIQYYKILECGQQIDAIHLNYLVILALNDGVNVQIQIAGGYAQYGSHEFIEDMK